MAIFDHMLSEKENKFLDYWESSREHESDIRVQIMKGLPMAMLFSLPIILSVVVVRLYFPEWYAKLSKTSPGMFITAIIAVLLIAFFYAWFRMRIRWENNEQLYQELKQKAGKQSTKTSNPES